MTFSSSPIPFASSDMSASPSQGTSLDSFSEISDALPPNPSTSNGSLDSNSVPSLNGDVSPVRRKSVEETEKSLRKYKGECVVLWAGALQRQHLLWYQLVRS